MVRIHEDMDFPEVPTRKGVIADPGVHHLTRAVLQASEGKDPVDAYYDVLLALAVLKIEMETILARGRGRRA